MSNSNYIGIFDSGMGGLTVVKSILQSMPNENIVYFGDTAHVPYGTRSKEQITEYVLNDVKFLSGFNIKAIVIACNTADSIARKEVESRYDLPVFGVVEPAAKKAVQVTKSGRIGVIATNATVHSCAYEKTIEKFSKDALVFSSACPLLVPLVENGRFRRGDGVIEAVLTEYLEPLKEKDIDTLVLGCTHYPLLYDLIEDIMPGITIISSSDAAAEALSCELKRQNLLNCGAGGKRKYFVSDRPDSFREQAQIFMGDAENMTVTLADV